MFQLSTLVALLVVAPAFVASSPNLPRTFDGLPREATKLAYDPDTGLISAFDKRGDFLGNTLLIGRYNNLNKRDTGSCVDLSADDVKALPGWDTLEAQARTNWGKGSYNLATNIDNENGYPAVACVSDSTAQVTLSDTPDCTTTTQTSSGTLVGTNGTVTLTTVKGTDTSTTTTTTKTTAFTLGVSVAATVGFPDIVDTTTTISTSLTVTNTLSSAVTTGSNQQQTSTITMSAKAGETCTLTFTNKACTGSGTGSIGFVATGWAWFEFNSKVDGHYYWALNMESVLDAADRTSSLEFSAAISATDLANYSGSCA
ncbi:hypothetical protein FB451DRAFT_1229452 [Mycena latifolia]|nr:hypothetical protein FB451DRAFT_1229452 [Mycena latifolia]